MVICSHYHMASVCHGTLPFAFLWCQTVSYSLSHLASSGPSVGLGKALATLGPCQTDQAQ